MSKCGVWTECRKIRTRKTLYLDPFHAMYFNVKKVYFVEVYTGSYISCMPDFGFSSIIMLSHRYLELWTDI